MCNVGGLGETFKCRLFKYFHEKDVHVALIQETHSTKKENMVSSRANGVVKFSLMMAKPMLVALQYYLIEK